jgi:hypothetical protein
MIPAVSVAALNVRCACLPAAAVEECLAALAELRPPPELDQPAGCLQHHVPSGEAISTHQRHRTHIPKLSSVVTASWPRCAPLSRKTGHTLLLPLHDFSSDQIIQSSNSPTYEIHQMTPQCYASVAIDYHGFCNDKYDELIYRSSGLLFSGEWIGTQQCDKAIAT